MLKVAVPAAGGLIVYIVHRWSDHAVVRFFTKSRAPFPRPGELAAHYSLRRLGFSAIWLGVFLVLFLVGIWITLALFKEGPIWVKGVTLFALPLGVPWHWPVAFCMG